MASSPTSSPSAPTPIKIEKAPSSSPIKVEKALPSSSSSHPPVKVENAAPTSDDVKVKDENGAEERTPPYARLIIANMPIAALINVFDSPPSAPIISWVAARNAQSATRRRYQQRWQPGFRPIRLRNHDRDAAYRHHRFMARWIASEQRTRRRQLRREKQRR